jgi:hypothetical protein
LVENLETTKHTASEIEEKVGNGERACRSCGSQQGGATGTGALGLGPPSTSQSAEVTWGTSEGAEGFGWVVPTCSWLGPPAGFIQAPFIGCEVQEAKITEAKINEARENYRPAAERASLLYFILNDLNKINPIYQFSLKVSWGAAPRPRAEQVQVHTGMEREPRHPADHHHHHQHPGRSGVGVLHPALPRCSGWESQRPPRRMVGWPQSPVLEPPMLGPPPQAFNVVFEKAIQKTAPADEVRQRVNNLTDQITYSVFMYTARGLFERDKLIFLAQVTFQVTSSYSNCGPGTGDMGTSGPGESKLNFNKIPG